jgi:ribosome maturation factor RimP
MINRDLIVQLVEEKLTDGQFIVSIKISSTNHISVIVDSFSGLTIKHCMDISRHIEGSLDREAEDFELQVSSAGLGEPFKIHQQFQKNKGKDVEVVMTDGTKLEGTLKEINEDGFELETRKREKVEGHKKKQLIVQVHRIEFDKAKTVKNIIKF